MAHGVQKSSVRVRENTINQSDVCTKRNNLKYNCWTKYRIGTKTGNTVRGSGVYTFIGHFLCVFTTAFVRVSLQDLIFSLWFNMQVINNDMHEIM